MKVAINALSAKVGGGWTYITNLLPELCALDNDISYIVIIDEDPERVAQLREIGGDRALVVELPLSRYRLSSSLYEQFMIWKLAKLQRPDILLCPAGIAPFIFPGKIVVLLRNMNHLKTDIKWNWSQVVRLGLLKYVVKFSAHRADHVVYVSRASSIQYGVEMKIPESKSRVVYHGISELFSTSKSGFTVSKSWVGKPYILSVSSIYRYKNFHTLINAYGQLVARGGMQHDLVIAGKNLDEPYYQELLADIERLDLSNRIHLLGEIPYTQISQLYQDSALFVFPSYLESFGHPLLEAMQAGVAILAADIEVSREIAADAAEYFEPMDSNVLAVAIDRLLKDEVRRKQLVLKGKQRVGYFSWTKTAREMGEIFNELAPLVECDRGVR